MAYRNIFIENPAKISCKRNQLIIFQENEISIPMEDINSIIIDNAMITITSFALATCSKQNVAVFFCNDKHIPNAYLLPYENYYHKLPIITSQFKMSKKTKGRIWQKIIKSKIQNQANNTEGVVYKELIVLRKSVDEYDSEYSESNAARIYFSALFGRNFNRRDDNVINASLNYGYAIVRGIICRELSAQGLEPSIAIFHHNQLNPFNLSDDLIEPFRGLVDKWIIERCLNKSDIDKESILRILFSDVQINGEYQSLSNAVKLMVQSYKKCCVSNSSSNLLLPTKIELREHEYE
ncbi:MAG: type II CRISPR-associated endonuclease Cas1 [Staphylococcus epidermidis]|nr:type II CRISPR-associated endonuclease Cas1 [Staphylococcus epidermidis]